MAYNSGYWEELESDLRKQLADARAEIERYKMGKVAPADYYSMAEAETELCNEIAALRAEIERLKAKNTASISAHMWAIMRHAFTDGAHKGYMHGTEYRLLTQMFAEWCSKNYPDAADNEVKRLTEIECKDALIEQTRDALRLADDLIDEYAADYEHRDNVDEVRDMIKAALSAAERGEGWNTKTKSYK